MSEGHSYFSASGSKKWIACPGSRVLEASTPSKASVHSARGTVAHLLFEQAILAKREPDSWLGEFVEQDGFQIEVDQTMVNAVTSSVGHAREMTVLCDTVLAETQVNYAGFLGVPVDKAWGTTDLLAVNTTQRELQVHDYKNGTGVDVQVEGNTQAMLYGLGGLAQFEDFADIDTVRLVVHQPHTSSAPKEWVISVDDLKAWGYGTARSAASSVQQAEKLHGAIDQAEWEATFLRPGSHCSAGFCGARATCPALRKDAVETVFGHEPASVEEFAEVSVPAKAHIAASAETWLGAVMAKADQIEDWIKQIRAEVERRLLAGTQVPGFKLVQGRRGARKWNADDIEKVLKGMRLKDEEMYDRTVISPTKAEELFKAGVIGPRQWPKLLPLISQPDGKPSVAPVTDKRAALELTPVAEDFSPVVENDDLI